MNIRPSVEHGGQYRPRGGYRGRGRGTYTQGPPPTFPHGGPRSNFYPRGQRPHQGDRGYPPVHHVQSQHQQPEPYYQPQTMAQPAEQAAQHAEGQLVRDPRQVPPKGGQGQRDPGSPIQPLAQVSVPPPGYNQVAQKGLTQAEQRINVEHEQANTDKDLAKTPSEWGRKLGHQGRPFFGENSNAWTHYRQPTGNTYVFLSRSFDEEQVISDMLDRLWGKQEGDKYPLPRPKDPAPKKRKQTSAETLVRNKRPPPLKIEAIPMLENGSTDYIILPDKAGSVHVPEHELAGSEEDPTVAKNLMKNTTPVEGKEENPFAQAFNKQIKRAALKLTIPGESQADLMNGEKFSTPPPPKEGA